MKLQSTLFCSFAAAALAMVSVAGAQTVLLQDDFESYATAAELGTSGPWNTPAGTWAISTDQAVSGTQSLYEAAGDSTTQVTAGFTAVDQGTLSPTNALIATYYVYPTSGGAIHRSGLNLASFETGGWGGGALEELLAWGFFSQESTTNFCHRVAFGPQVSTHPQGWTISDKEIGFDEWNKLTIVLDGTDIYFDLNDSGEPSVDATDAVLTLGWTGARLGSFLGFGTANDTNIYYDDVEIKLDVAPVASVTDWHLN